MIYYIRCKVCNRLYPYKEPISKCSGFQCDNIVRTTEVATQTDLDGEHINNDRVEAGESLSPYTQKLVNLTFKYLDRVYNPHKYVR